MKNMRNILVMMCLLAIGTAWAVPINENQARSIASNFMSSHAMQATNLKMTHKAPLKGLNANENAAYYVFNANSRGFVIVAGDDRAPAVLGYSDKGTFDAEAVPEAMQTMLEGYAAQITALGQGAKPAPRLTANSAIRPLVTASWSQDAPFNILFPILPNGNRAVTGCVATAMAQVLYYWKHPATSTTIPEYTSQSLGIYMPALEPAQFNWQAMQDIYTGNDTQSESAVAVAQLTLYCAQSVQMNFMYGVSGANSGLIPGAISSYFGYKANARCEYRENFTTQGWSDLIYDELSNGRPVIYSASKASGGHAFICDGYDGEGMFHMNWGWGGMSNGYYLLNVLNPDAQGTGSASEAYGYILDQSIIAGIEPGEAEAEFAVTANEIALVEANTARESSSDNFMVRVNCNFCNYTPQTIDMSFGWGLYQGDELISVIYNSSITQLPPSYFVPDKNRRLNFGSGITSGTYRLVPIYSEYRQGNWRPCKGAEVNYIEVTIDGNECTIIGHGMAGERDYTVNSITNEGALHSNRPVNLTMNLTNNGYSQNDLLYMFVNGSNYCTAYLGLEHGETGDIPFQFLPTAPGSYTCTFSFNEDGSDPICQTTLDITEMPAANLNITSEVLNVTDPANNIITSDKFSLKLTITNNGQEAYADDVTIKLYRRTTGNSGSNIQEMNKFVGLSTNTTVDVQFDLDNVIDGQDYFAVIFYYSAGRQIRSGNTAFYTIQFPDEPEPQFIPGDVNDDGAVNIADVTALIDYLLGSASNVNELAADVNGDKAINIADVTALIDMLLSN